MACQDSRTLKLQIDMWHASSLLGPASQPPWWQKASSVSTLASGWPPLPWITGWGKLVFSTPGSLTLLQGVCFLLFLWPHSTCPLCLQYKESGMKCSRQRARAKALGWEQICLFKNQEGRGQDGWSVETKGPSGLGWDRGAEACSSSIGGLR